MRKRCGHGPANLDHASTERNLRFSEDRDNAAFPLQNIAMEGETDLHYFDQKRTGHQWGSALRPRVPAEASFGEGVFLGLMRLGCRRKSRQRLPDRRTCRIETTQDSVRRAGFIHPQGFVGFDARSAMIAIHPHSTIGQRRFGYSVEPVRPVSDKSVSCNVKIAINGSRSAETCAVDARRYTSTHIRRHQARPNLCHIAHNCDLGEGFYTAGFMTGGPRTRPPVRQGGGSVVRAVTLADNCACGRSTVRKTFSNRSFRGVIRAAVETQR